MVQSWTGIGAVRHPTADGRAIEDAVGDPERGHLTRCMVRIGGMVDGLMSAKQRLVELTASGREPLRLAISEWNGPSDGQESVLLVHGLASNRSMWDGVGAALASRGHHVIAVDQRGHGRSDKPESGYGFADVVADLVSLIEETTTGPVCAVGQSWGGNVVVELAHRHAGSVNAVVCVDGGFIDLASRFASWDECEKVLAPPKLVGTPYAHIENWARQAHPDWPETGIRGSLANFERREDGTIAPWLTFDRHIQILRALYEHDPASALEQIEMPVRFLVADSEAAWAQDKRAAIDALLPRVRRGAAVWIRGDHDLHAQHPERVADEIEATIERKAHG